MTPGLAAIIASIRGATARPRLARASVGIRAALAADSGHDAAGATATATGTAERLRAAVAALRNVGKTGRLRHAVPNVAKAFHDLFEREARPRYERLLAVLRSGCLPLAALSACGRGTREIRYTQLLAYILNPRQPHGLGHHALQTVLAPLLADLDIRPTEAEWGGAEVRDEAYLGSVQTADGDMGCTVDVRISFRDWDVYIEQKLFSSEFGSLASGELSQLRRYSEAIAAKRPGRPCLKVFLTPDGRHPKDDPTWQPVTHAAVVRCLAHLLDHPELPVLARHNLRCVLWDLMCGPLQFTGLQYDLFVRRLVEVLRKPSRCAAFERWAVTAVGDFDTILAIVETGNG